MQCRHYPTVQCMVCIHRVVSFTWGVTYEYTQSWWKVTAKTVIIIKLILDSSCHLTGDNRFSSVQLTHKLTTQIGTNNSKKQVIVSESAAHETKKKCWRKVARFFQKIILAWHFFLEKSLLVGSCTDRHFVSKCINASMKQNASQVWSTSDQVKDVPLGQTSV